MKISDDELKKRLNLNVVDLLSNTPTFGWLDMPKMYCPNITNIDYIALYTEPGLYTKKSNTIISFYNYDIKFDAIDGLFNAIYYNNKKLLEKFKDRFEDCILFISPDYSECGDVHFVENLYRIHNEKLPSDKLYHFYFYRELKKDVIGAHRFWCGKNSKRNIEFIPSLIVDERIPREALSRAIYLVDDNFKRENDIPKYYELTEKELIKKSYKKYPINTIEYFLFNLSYSTWDSARDSVFDNLKDRIIYTYSNNFFDLKRIPNINLS